jgi:hypothetical protein
MLEQNSYRLGGVIMDFSRRDILGSIGSSIALGSFSSTLATPALSAQPAAAAAPAVTYCLAMIYRQAEGATFDGDMFRDLHLPILKRVYGDSMERVELRMPAPVAEGAPAAQIIATVNLWFSDAAEFIKRTNTSAREVNASMTNITKAPVMGQLDQVLSVVGDDRKSVPVDSFCLSTYFLASDTATIDAKYFTESFFPKMAEMYGATAIRRIEVTAGAAATGGGKLSIMNSAHIYINDQAAYIEAETKSGAELATEAQKHTNIRPLNVLTRLHAAG